MRVRVERKKKRQMTNEMKILAAVVHALLAGVYQNSTAIEDHKTMRSHIEAAERYVSEVELSINKSGEC